MAVAAETASLFAQIYEQAKPFEPTAFFDPDMDQLIYQITDESCRAERIDDRLTILWAAYEPQMVGLKLKGFREIFEDLKRQGLVEEKNFGPSCEAFGIHLKSIVEVASQTLAKSAPENKEHAGYYRRATNFVGERRIHIPPLGVAA